MRVRFPQRLRHARIVALREFEGPFDVLKRENEFLKETKVANEASQDVVAQLAAVSEAIEALKERQPKETP